MKEARPRRHALYDSIYVKFYKGQKYSDGTQIVGYLGPRDGGRGDCKGTWG